MWISTKCRYSICLYEANHHPNIPDCNSMSILVEPIDQNTWHFSKPWQSKSTQRFRSKPLGKSHTDSLARSLLFKPGSIGWTGTGWTGTACTAWSTGSCWVSGGTMNFTTRIAPKHQSRTIHGCRLYVRICIFSYMKNHKTISKFNHPWIGKYTGPMDGIGMGIVFDCRVDVCKAWWWFHDPPWN